MRAIVFANGEFAPPADVAARLEGAQLLIAADGGLKHLRALGRQPDVLVGDMDSVAAEEVKALEAAGVSVQRHPVDKDQTDLELALLEAAARGADAVEVLGGLGRRWDHSLANLLIPALPALAGIRVEFLHGEQRLFLIRAGTDIAGAEGTRLSLIPVGGVAEGVRTEGLAFPLAGKRLSFGSSRGVSNVMEGARARVGVGAGLLLCVISTGELE